MKSTETNLLKRLREDSPRMAQAIRDEALKYRFLAGSHNAVKLRRSLALIGRLDLVEKTLLSPKVHKVHAARLTERYLKKWEKIKTTRLSKWSSLPPKIKKGLKKPTNNDIASTHLRFFTLIHDVTTMDHQSALKSVKKMKVELLKALKATKGMWCLGVIEGEVISISSMKDIQRTDKGTESEKRKLDVCETLASDLKNSLYKNETTHFLIHFHGVLVSNKESKFDELVTRLKKVNQWNKAPRQIEVKRLSTSFANKDKLTEQNLKHISTYITKGGNDWCSNKAYLRYKVGFELDVDDVTDEQTWVLKNWRRNELLKKEHAEDGIEDILSLRPQEVAELTLFIDGLMSLNRNRTGYLISTGS